jgi:hypothetical protein
VAPGGVLKALQPLGVRPGPAGDGARRAAGTRDAYSAAWASAAQPSGGILRVTNTFMSRAGFMHPAAPTWPDPRRRKWGVAWRARGGAGVCAGVCATLHVQGVAVTVCLCVECECRTLHALFASVCRAALMTLRLMGGDMNK